MIKNTSINFVDGLIQEMFPLTEREVNNLDNELMEKWYRDYDVESLYSGVNYLHQQLLCYRKFTVNNLNSSIKILNSFGYIPRKILDFGAGIGLSTLRLAQAYPEAEIFYYEYPNPNNREIVEKLFNEYKITNVKILDSDVDFKSLDYDTLVLFEILEHFRTPLLILDNLLTDKVNIVLESSYHHLSAGHYLYFNNGDETFQLRHVEKYIREFILNRKFRRFGEGILNFKKYMWNGKPNVFIKESIQVTLI